MTNSPLVSIIIPTYNRAHLIGETLDSVLVQTYTNWECIVVDDGSTDNTAEVMIAYCATDARIQYYKRPEQRTKGGNACRNYGFELSKGQFINWFDSDDIYAPEALDTWLKAFDSATDVVVSPLQRFDHETKQHLGCNSINKQPLIPAYLVGKVAWYTDGPMWRRQFLEQQTYLFDETIAIIQDWDFNLRMLYQKPNIHFLDRAQIKYRVHGQSLQKRLSQLQLLYIAADFKVRKQHLDLLATYYPSGIPVLQQFMLQRRKHFVKLAYTKDKQVVPELLKALKAEQIKQGDYLGLIKTYLGVWAYKLTGRGYWFFK